MPQFLSTSSCLYPYTSAKDVSPLSPTFPTNQTPSYITTSHSYRQEPSPFSYGHQYRPFRVPATKSLSTHEIITRLLSLGDSIPKGAFLPVNEKAKPRTATKVNGRPRVPRVDRVVRVDVEVVVEACEEPATQRVLDICAPSPPEEQEKHHAKEPISRNTSAKAQGKLSILPRRRDTIKARAAKAAALGRGPSCSSTASTVKPVTLTPKPSVRSITLAVPIDTKKANKRDTQPPQIPALHLSVASPLTEQTPYFQGIPLPDDSASPRTSEDSTHSMTSSPYTSSEDEAIQTPQTGQVVELPGQEPTDIPETPLHPPTPLDNPVDWDDLREHLAPNFNSAAPSRMEEHADAESDLERDLTSPANFLAASRRRRTVSRSIVPSSFSPPGEGRLSDMTSKDLGDYFGSPSQDLLGSGRFVNSALFAPSDWAAEFTLGATPGSVDSFSSQAKKMFAEVSRSGQQYNRRRSSAAGGIIINPDSLRSTMMFSPSDSNFSFPKPPTYLPTPPLPTTQTSLSSVPTPKRNTSRSDSITSLPSPPTPLPLQLVVSSSSSSHSRSSSHTQRSSTVPPLKPMLMANPSSPYNSDKSITPQHSPFTTPRPRPLSRLSSTYSNSDSSNHENSHSQRDSSDVEGAQPKRNIVFPLRPVSTSGRKRHGRLLSLDEQELVMKTVRFSDTLDPEFDYTKFSGKEQQQERQLPARSQTVDTAASPNLVQDFIDKLPTSKEHKPFIPASRPALRTIRTDGLSRKSTIRNSDIVQKGTTVRGRKVVGGDDFARGQSFLSVEIASPMTPSRRWSHHVGGGDSWFFMGDE